MTEIINQLHHNNIFIYPKIINNNIAIIEINNKNNLIQGKNTYNIFNKPECYAMWHNIETLNKKYFETIIK